MDEWLKILGLAQKSGNVITGTDRIVDKIRNNSVKLVIAAEDAAVNTKKLLKDKCAYYNVQYIELGKVKEMSLAMGKENRVAVGICDEGFVKGLLAKVSNRGDYYACT